MCWWLGERLRIATRRLPKARAGVAYRVELFADGGAPPYRWSAEGLPAGLLPGLESIAGTAMVEGRFRVRLEVTDMAANTASLTLTLVVAPGLTVTAPAAIPEAFVGSAYSLQLSISGGLAPYSVSASGLPSGLAVDNTGLISGTPTTATASTGDSVTVTVTDAA